MRRSTQALFILAAALCLPLQALAATPAAKPMTPREIQATFGTGTPFSSSTPSGMTYTVTLNTDGTASRMPHKGKVAITGKWRVSKDGYCSTWGKGTENCYEVEKDADRYKVLDTHAAVVAYWKAK